MTKLAKRDVEADGLDRVLLGGDLGSLSSDQRVKYYQRVCESVGLNPLTQPFEYLRLNGKTVLYAKRACTDQLRKVHRVSVSIVSRERMDGIYVVTARASTPDGRSDESIGAVPIDGLRGENLSNALMKGETKAKRRVTLAICGLSILDETEVESVPSTRRRSLDDVANDSLMTEAVSSGMGPCEPSDDSPTPHDPETGEVVDAQVAPTMPPGEPYVFPRGKHEGQSVLDVPAGYLRALREGDYWDRYTQEAREWITYAIDKHEWEKG